MAAVMKVPAGASSTIANDWKTIEWKKAVADVRLLQMRIAKAFREGKHGKVKSLQWLLTHSFYAKLLAVKRVVQNQGAKTPGIDGVVWKTPKQKMNAAISLKRRGYKTKPLRRIYIPKKQKGKLRPLSIPAMQCRAQQALHLLSLEPIVEMLADKNSYGFRPLRSTADAIAQCFNSLAKQSSAQYILEGDIKACFDTIDHQWLHENVSMDKVMLKKWLTAGYMEKGRLYPTEQGAAQGGPISPAISTIALSGLEATVNKVASEKDKVNVCIYADDFIITGATKEVLENKVKPVVESFLKIRGLTLSQEKTKITSIHEGFDFLGANIRKYKGKLLIRPAKSNVNRFLADIRETIKKNAATETEALIHQLNLKIQGWANHHRHVCAKKAFSYVDNRIFLALRSWARRRHPNKTTGWVARKYLRSVDLRNWVFTTRVKDKKNGKTTYLDLIQSSKTPIIRHIKVRADATPFNPIYHEYLSKRVWIRKKISWEKCWWELLHLEQKTEETGHHKRMALQRA